MPKTFKPQIVSANDLLEGDVVYLTPSHSWSRHLADAAVAHTAEAAAALLAAAAQPERVVGPALADVALAADAPQPLHYREAIRARGPSFRKDLGKQAAASSVDPTPPVTSTPPASRPRSTPPARPAAAPTEDARVRQPA